MKLNSLKTLPLTLLPLFGFADEVPPPPVPAAPKTFIEYHNRMVVFNLAHQSYERIKPDSLYVGVEGWALNANLGDGIAEGELRFGYNFFYNHRDHFTPVIGVGVFKEFVTLHQTTWTVDEWGNVSHERSRHKLPPIGYGMIGFLYDHEFNTIFNLGLNVKGMLGGSDHAKHFSWGGFVQGFDIALPITFRFGHKRHWDFRLEPFDLYFHGSERSRNFFGFRSTVGYRF